MPSSMSPVDRPALEQITAATDYVGRVCDIVRAIGHADDPIQAVELLRDVTLRMGAEAAIFGSFIPEDRSGHFCRVLVACDPLWYAEYEAQAYYAEDPWLAYAFRHSEPIRGSELLTLTEKERGVVLLAERFGFRSSVIVPAPSCGRLARMGVLCVGSSTPGYFDGEGYLTFKIVARSVALEFHEWWLARIRDELVAKAGIDDHDRHLLALDASGLSSKEIARQLATTAYTIEGRFKSIQRRLKATSRKAASRLATEYGLISPPSFRGREP